MRLRDGVTKYIFKRAMRGILPDAIIDRPKRGFAIPLGRWFRGSLAAFSNDLLLSPQCRHRGILNPAYLRKLLDMHTRGRDLDMHLWTIVSFELWCRKFLDSPSWQVDTSTRHAALQTPATAQGVL
jgi:asparagine synthase (glutamine-hydrolysing)